MPSASGSWSVPLSPALAPFPPMLTPLLCVSSKQPKRIHLAWTNVTDNKVTQKCCRTMWVIVEACLAFMSMSVQLSFPFVILFFFIYVPICY